MYNILKIYIKNTSIEAKLVWETELAKCKLIDVKQIAKDILYSNLRLFDFTDKAGKPFARILVNTANPKLPLMYKSHGILTDHIDKKLDMFTLFFFHQQNSYRSTVPS